MPITRMNHAVLYVRNAERTARFYERVLDFKVLSMDPDGKYAFLNAPASHNDHDIAFFSIGDTAGPSTAGAETVGLYHLAWEVPALEDLVRLRQRLVEAGALVGESNHETHLSLYAKDPDGLEFELSWFVPADRVDPGANLTASHPLDLDAELERYEADAASGPVP
ncbi:MAG: VOC family protein [Actinomycetota bacterium]|nr:VOC family protein [Actinomycetota bacterium]